MGVQYRVRPASDVTPGEWRALTQLTNAASRHDFRDDGRPAGSVLRKRIRAHLAGEEYFPDDCWVIQAQVSAATVAWCLVTQHQFDHHGEPLIVPTGSAAFYVDPDYRRQGIGSCLVQEACETARKNGMQRLLVNPWNARSSSFFNQSGFISIEDMVPGWCNGVSALDL